MSDAVVRDTTPGVRHLELSTPEHVSVDFALADLGSRFVALLADLTIVIVGLVAVVFFWMVTVLDSVGDDTVTALIILVSFLWRNFYFTASEVFGQGRTLGKRFFRLRVVARDGGPLSAERIFARNLTRDLEIFLPMTLLISPESLIGGAPWWARLATTVWILVLGFLPFFNRHGARLGDLVAGTLVVVEPTSELLEDLVEDEPLGGHDYTFNQAQLDIYGIRELQVLEDVLRRSPSEERDHLLEQICEKVQNKIGWDRSSGPVQPKIFLQAFYAAQRGRLEGKMLMGRRQEVKVDINT